MKVVMRDGKIVLRPNNTVQLIGDEDDPCSAPCECIPTIECTEMITSPIAWTLVVPDEFVIDPFDPRTVCVAEFFPGTHDLYKSDHVARFHSCGGHYIDLVSQHTQCRWKNVDTDAETVTAVLQGGINNPCNSPENQTRTAYQSPYSYTEYRPPFSDFCSADPSTCSTTRYQDQITANNSGDSSIIVTFSNFSGLRIHCTLSYRYREYRDVLFGCEPDDFLQTGYSVTWRSEPIEPGTDISKSPLVLTQSASPDSPNEIILIPAEIEAPS